MKITIALAAVLLTWSAHADSSDAFDTGTSFFKACRNDNLDQKVTCIGKASDYADMLQALNMVCLNGANRKQVTMVILKFLSEHLDDADKTAASRPAASIALAALTKAFPCHTAK